MLSAVRKVFDRFQPVPAATNDFLRQTELTPDIWQLEQFQYLRIFVPCDMMTGKINNNLVKDASKDGKPLHPTCYTHNDYTFWKKDLGEHSYGVPLPASYRPTGFVRWPVEGARIRGELWGIRPNQFIVLDRLRQHGRMFVRRRVPITLPYRTVSYDDTRRLPNISDHKYFQTVDAWMYFGIPEYWDPQIGGIFAKAQLELHEHDQRRLWMNKFYKWE